MGCAGLSLAMRLIHAHFLSSFSILLIDVAPKQENDRTWCFWEDQPGWFEPIVYHRWTKAQLHTEQHTLQIQLQPFAYKMIRGIDFYQYAHEQLQQARNNNADRRIDYLYEPVLQMEREEQYAIVHTTQHRVQAKYVFYSLLSSIPPTSYRYFLWQHFRGWFVHMHASVFDPECMVLMDFRVPQQEATAFMYVLPFSDCDALIEYTVFSPHLLDAQVYDACIRHYLQTHYPGLTYDITEMEKGAIPMTDYAFPTATGTLIPIGTAGGQTKASTGYTFSFIQRHSDALIKAWEKTGKPLVKSTLHERAYRWYDQLLLHVLQHRLYPGDALFLQLFQNNPTPTVLRFLSNQSSWSEDIRIIASLPTKPFLKALLSIR